jgi:hypothetical protein
LRRLSGRVDGMAIFLRDDRTSVIYSSTAVVERFSKLFILTSYAVRQHMQPMMGSPIS